MATVAAKNKKFTTFNKQLEIFYNRLVYTSPSEIRVSSTNPEWIWLYVDGRDTHHKYAIWLVITCLKEKRSLTIDDIKVDDKYLLDWFNSSTNRRTYCQQYTESIEPFKEAVLFEDLIKGGFFEYCEYIKLEVRNAILKQVDNINFVSEKELP